MKFSQNAFILATFLVASSTNIYGQANAIYYTSELRSSGRDIYKIDGSKKTKLTQKMGRGHYPHNNNAKLSPDGSRLVFQSDPDGHDRYSIWVMDIDGSNLKRISDKEGLYPNWSPDGSKIIYSGRRNGTWEILTMAVDGGKEEFVSNNSKSGIRPSWGATCSFHPDGQSIVYTYIREKALYQQNLNTNEKTRLGSAQASYTYPMFSTDGSTIAVNRKTDNAYHLVFLTEDGNEKVITKNVVSYSGSSWTNNESEILFTGVVKGKQEIFRKNLSSGEEIQITFDSEFSAMPTSR